MLEQNFEGKFSPMSGDSPEMVNRMNMANETKEASSDEAKEFMDKYFKEMSVELAAGHLTIEDIDALLQKTKNLRESQASH